MAESLFKEKMVDNFLNLGRDLDIQVPKAHRSPNKLNLKKSSPGDIITKLSKIKDKERVLKAAKVKRLVNYKGTPISLSMDFKRVG